MAMENDLGRDSVPKLVIKIAVPSMIAQFVNVLYSIVDRIFVGNIPQLGELSLAGVGVCGPVVTMVGAFSFLIGIGGAPLMGINLGARNHKKAEEILSNCFLMLIAAALILTAVILPLRRPMLQLFGASTKIYPYAEAYFTIYISGTVFALLALGMNQFVIAQGFARTGMYSVILGAVMNIILDPVFIFVFHMGVRGAALATIISQACSAAFILCFLFGKKATVRIRFGGYCRKIMFRVIKLGLSPFLIIAMDNLMIIAMNALLQKYGGPEQGDALITCNTIVQSFMLVLTMPLGGISGGTQSILSFNYGACQTERVLKAQKYITGLCVCYTLLMFILARAAGPLFAALFTSDPELNRQACRAIRICTAAAVPLGVQYAIVDGFTALGQVRYSLPLSLWRKTSYFVSIFILPVFFGASSVFYAEPISDISGPIVAVTVYFCSMKKILDRRKALENEDML